MKWFGIWQAAESPRTATYLAMAVRVVRFKPTFRYELVSSWLSWSDFDLQCCSDPSFIADPAICLRWAIDPEREISASSESAGHTEL
jgi:hypothetical protein